jgi:hypothetical protein
MRYALGLVFFFVIGYAQATPLDWTISDAFFDDQTSLTGGFTYDQSSNTYSNVSITTVATSVINGSTYTSLSGSALGTSGNITLRLVFADLLTDIGGAVALSSSTREGCGLGSPFGGPACNLFGQAPGPQRFLVSGRVSADTGSEMPIPSTAWLLASALIGLGWSRRKQYS